MIAENGNATISIMVVEDNQLANKIICKTLSIWFPLAIIYSAINGKIGLDLFRIHSPDVVITDISMPDMDGFQMSIQIKSMSTDTDIIVFTGHSEDEYFEQFNELGIHSYFTKPLDLTELVSAIDKTIQKKHIQS